MKARAAAVLAGAVLAAWAAHADETPVWQKPPALEARGDVLDYEGFLNPAGAEAAVPKIASGRFKVLRIASAGGDLGSAMKIGRALRQQGMDVAVAQMCLSSCANYVFPAGARKTIEPGAIVAWHGDARQKSWMLRLDLLKEWEEKLGKSAIAPHDRQWINTTRENIRLQDAYYAEIGVADGIARMGQEMDPPVTGFWALPVEGMVLFGMADITAPPDYARDDYCERFGAAPGHPRVTCMNMRHTDVLIWIRRTLGPRR